MLEQGNSSLSQSVTVYPALPRQPAGDLLATGRMMMMTIMMVMTMIMMTFTKKTAGDLLATVRRITRDDDDGDGDHHNFFCFFVCTKGLHIGCNLVKSK